MRSCFVDTSAFYAVLDASDRYHPRAAKRWASLLDEGADLVTTNYVLLETVALLQGRLGLEAVRVFTDDVQPLLRVEWLKEGDHRNAAEALILAEEEPEPGGLHQLPGDARPGPRSGLHLTATSGIWASSACYNTTIRSAPGRVM